MKSLKSKKDINIILKFLNSEGHEEKEEEVKQEEGQESERESEEKESTPKEAVQEEVVDNNEEIKIQTAAERTIALIKDEVELEKLKEELMCFEKEKKELEETVHNRNKEIYELNERIILLEYKASLGDSKQEDEDPSDIKEIQS